MAPTVNIIIRASDPFAAYFSSPFQQGPMMAVMVDIMVVLLRRQLLLLLHEIRMLMMVGD